MRLEEWRATGRTFTFQRLPVFYHDQGDGPALVCIHGFPTASWDWHKLWPGLTNDFRVVAPDMLGFGFSAKPGAHTYSIHEQADLHEALLHHLGIDRVHILAHDYGDTVAQELLARYQDRQRAGGAGIKFESVCLLNGGLFPETHRPLLVQRLLLTPLGPLIARLMSQTRLHDSLRAIFGRHTQPSEAELSEFWTLIAHNDGTKVTHKLISYIPERRRFRARWVGALEQTQTPLRFINGPADPISGAHMVARYRELISNADVVELEGIGHYPQIEDPDGVLRAFFAFVGPIIRDTETIAHAPQT